MFRRSACPSPPAAAGTSSTAMIRTNHRHDVRPVRVHASASMPAALDCGIRPPPAGTVRDAGLTSGGGGLGIVTQQRHAPITPPAPRGQGGRRTPESRRPPGRTPADFLAHLQRPRTARWRAAVARPSAPHGSPRDLPDPQRHEVRTLGDHDRGAFMVSASYSDGDRKCVGLVTTTSASGTAIPTRCIAICLASLRRRPFTSGSPSMLRRSSFTSSWGHLQVLRVLPSLVEVVCKADREQQQGWPAAHPAILAMAYDARSSALSPSRGSEVTSSARAESRTQPTAATTMSFSALISGLDDVAPVEEPLHTRDRAELRQLGISGSPVTMRPDLHKVDQQRGQPREQAQDRQ